MRIGAHVSIAGGIWNAPERAAAIGCECFQLFTRSPQGGAAPPLIDEVVTKFRRACEQYNQRLWVVHTPYYINLASLEARTRENSVRIIREELERASAIGARYVMTHLGSAREVGEEHGRAYVIEGLARVLDSYDGSAKFLIEISAGTGAIIGDTFEEIAEIIRAVEADLPHPLSLPLPIGGEKRRKKHFSPFVRGTEGEREGVAPSASASTPSTPSPPATTSAHQRQSPKRSHTSTARSASRASKCLT